MVEMDGSGAGLGVVAILAWQHYRGGTGAEGLASGNGRNKATEIDVAAKFAGRVREILVREGDFVNALARGVEQVIGRVPGPTGF